jgi:hypothetical protein
MSNALTPRGKGEAWWAAVVRPGPSKVGGWEF